MFLSRTSSSDSSDRTSCSSIGKSLPSSYRLALDELKYICQARNVYWTTPETEGRSVTPRNDDVTLLRYLRARDFDIQAAFRQYNATVQWRRKLGLEEMYRNVDVPHFEAIRRLMPQWTGRRSHHGVPLFVYAVAKVSPDDLLATSRKDPSLSSVFLPAEYSTQFVQPLCARMHVTRAMPHSMFIIDLTGVGIRHFWNLRNHLQKASTMATSHYPDSVDKIFVSLVHDAQATLLGLEHADLVCPPQIIGAPSFFPKIWGYINKWFEPSMTAKMSVLATAEVKQTLLQHVDEKDLPEVYGGTLLWEYGMRPDLDDECRGLVGPLAIQWVEGPLKLVGEERGDSAIITCLGKDVRDRARERVLSRIPRSLHPLDEESD